MAGFSSIQLVAQNKMLSMEDAILGQWRQFYPETLSQLQWKGNENVYTFIEGKELKFAKPGAEATKLLSLKELNKAMEAAELKTLDWFPEISWVNSNTIQFQEQNHLIHFDIVQGNVILKIQYPADAENLEYKTSIQKLAYTRKNNLFFTDSEGNEVAVTNDQDKNFVNGQSVSRNEYGIDGGIFWSPQGKSLAFYRKDETNVTSFPLVDINTRVGDLREVKYPMAGMKSEHVTLGVYNMASGSTVWIDPTDFGHDQYLTNISWGAAGNYVYIQVLNRETTHMKLNKYEASTGKFVKTLFEEKDERWVEPQHKLSFLKKNPDQFLYQTNTRDGFNHLYLFNTDGKLIRQLTNGEWMVTEVLGFDKAERYLYYVSTEVSPLDRHVYKVDIRTGKRSRLTAAEGYHNVLMSADASFFIDNYSSLDVPRIIQIVNRKGKSVQQLVKAENTLKDYKLGEVSLGKIKSPDEKTDLYYRLIKPADFDPNKKYPVVVYVYGGPHAQLVTNRWMGGLRLWEQHMAQQGYVMFTLDNRGSANRGKEFEAVIHRQCGQPEMADQMAGVEYLKSLPYVDADRIGVHGWSYGGFMTISLLTNYPETFKVAVAGGPVIDWKWYEVMYGERYMDTPEENPQGYAKVSLMNKAKDLKGKLLICQGAIDKTVLWQHSLNFIRECIKNNVQVDYFPYPRAEHNVRGEDRIHLKQKVTNYFEDYLK
jgi:dipeptidyl-peptidase-4